MRLKDGRSYEPQRKREEFRIPQTTYNRGRPVNLWDFLVARYAQGSFTKSARYHQVSGNGRLLISKDGF